MFVFNALLVKFRRTDVIHLKVSLAQKSEVSSAGHSTCACILLPTITCRSAWTTMWMWKHAVGQASGCTATDSSLKGAWRGAALNGLVRDSVARGACAHRSSVFCARLQFCLCQPALDERKDMCQHLTDLPLRT